LPAAHLRRIWSSPPCPAQLGQAPINTNILIYLIKILLIKILLIKILLPQVDERIYALDDDDSLAKSLIRIAGLQPRP
jgi:hypothetical protein